MKACKMLFINDGENLGTCSILRPFTEADIPLLNVMESYCVSYDNDMLVECNKYTVKEILIPDWMEPEEYTAGVAINLAYSFLLGYKEEMGRDLFQASLPFSYEYRIAFFKLMNTKTFRSEFRKSIYEKVKLWLETPAEERKYNSPLSNTQWRCIVTDYDIRDAKRLHNTRARIYTYA